MGTNYESPNNLQFNPVLIFFYISCIPKSSLKGLPLFLTRKCQECLSNLNITDSDITHYFFSFHFLKTTLRKINKYVILKNNIPKEF